MQGHFLRYGVLDGANRFHNFESRTATHAGGTKCEVWSLGSIGQTTPPDQADFQCGYDVLLALLSVGNVRRGEAVDIHRS